MLIRQRPTIYVPAMAITALTASRSRVFAETIILSATMIVRKNSRDDAYAGKIAQSWTMGYVDTRKPN
jgi:hypothetical protein